MQKVKKERLTSMSIVIPNGLIASNNNCMLPVRSPNKISSSNWNKKNLSYLKKNEVASLLLNTNMSVDQIYKTTSLRKHTIYDIQEKIIIAQAIGADIESIRNHALPDDKIDELIIEQLVQVSSIDVVKIVICSIREVRKKLKITPRDIQHLTSKKIRIKAQPFLKAKVN